MWSAVANSARDSCAAVSLNTAARFMRLTGCCWHTYATRALMGANLSMYTLAKKLATSFQTIPAYSHACTHLCM